MMKIQCGDERGAALVELALTAPLFMLLMMGAIELGRVAYYAIEVQNAARAGASYGSVNIGNANQTSNVQQAAKNDAPDIAGLVVVSPGSTCVCQIYNVTAGTRTYNPSSGTTSCSSSTIKTNCSADNATEIDTVIEYVTVSTSASVNPLVKIPSLPSTYSLSGASALRILPN